MPSNEMTTNKTANDAYAKLLVECNMLVDFDLIKMDTPLRKQARKKFVAALLDAEREANCLTES